MAHSLRIFIIAIGYQIPRQLDNKIKVFFVLVKLLLLKKLNKIVLIRFNIHIPFNIFSGSFPTAPDFNEILMDGTVFHADSNGMSVFFFKK